MRMGEYRINQRGCVCNGISNKADGAVVGCRCAFPIAGEPKKRVLEFVA